MSQATIAVRTRKSVAEAEQDLGAACQAHGFGVVGGHDLRAKLEAKGVALGFECKVVDVCNPHQAKRVLDAAPEVSAVLPCRVSITPHPEGGSVFVTVAPTQMIGLFPIPSLKPVAEEVEATLRAILARAAG